MGGMVVEGRTVDAEIGLFAMKRDAVFIRSTTWSATI